MQGEPFGSGTAFRMRIESNDRLSLFAVDPPLRRRSRRRRSGWRLPEAAEVHTALEEPEQATGEPATTEALTA